MCMQGIGDSTAFRWASAESLSTVVHGASRRRHLKTASYIVSTLAWPCKQAGKCEKGFGKRQPSLQVPFGAGAWMAVCSCACL